MINGQWMEEVKPPENVPVLRRRRYTRQQRKSLIIEPETSLILAGVTQNSSSDEDPNNQTSTFPLRKYGAKRRMKKRFHNSASNLKCGQTEESIGTKSLSVRDLNGDNIDFNNRDSVKKWTSQIFAELESIPTSRRGSVDVTRMIPPEVVIENRSEITPLPAKRSIFPVATESTVGPTYLRDLLSASYSHYPESNCSDRLATVSDTTQKASRASSFEWLNGNEELKNECSSDEADREVASIGMTNEVKVDYEALDKSVIELENLKNATWFPPPPPPEEHDLTYDSLPTTFRKRRPPRNASVYDNSALLPELLKLSRAMKSDGSPSRKSVSTKPFAIENLPMVQRLSEFNAKDSKPTTFSSDFALQLTERDAVDACVWLRKAGFSKYADQFDEGKLPISIVEPTLSDADLRSLTRRISILNRCHAMKNNEYPRASDAVGHNDDSTSAYSDNWRYGAQTWSRPSASDHHVYSGTLNRIPHQKPAWHQHSNQHQMMNDPRGTVDGRKVLRTDWYDAQNSRGRVNDTSDSSSTAACVNELNSAKLQRSQSERIKDRARAIMKKMDLRSNTKRQKEPRSRPAPLNIGDPVLVSYDTPKNSVRSHHIDRPSILPERGRALYNAPFQSQSRSKSIAQNRRGLVFVTPTSPDPFSDATSTSSRSRRELSMPPPTRHRINHVPTPPDSTLRRREIMPFDSYLYPENYHLIDRFENNERLVPNNNDPNNISMFNDGYYTHEIKPSVPRHHKPENLKVNTEKIEVLSSSDEPNGKTTLTRRSDSGLGSSLSRSPSGPYSQRIRQSLLPYPHSNSASSCCSWSSKQQEEEPYYDIELARSIDSLSLIEMTKLRRSAHQRLTSILERNLVKSTLPDPEHDESPVKQAWSVHRLIKKMKIADGQQKSPKESGEEAIFGVGLDAIFHRTGYFLPRPILEVMAFLRSTSAETVGIFRKNGVKSRIAELRAIIDQSSQCQSDVFVGENSLDSTQVHDVADLLKQYLRDLPEPLMTVKMSEVFANICSAVPDVDRFTALQYAIVLLPDENREALKTLLLFLKDVSRSSQVNNMTAQNLSVCFTPSLFQLSASRLDKPTPGSRRHKTVGGTGLPSEKEMKEARACQLCLTMLIEYAPTVFMAPDCVDTEQTDVESEDIPILTDLGLKGPRSFLVDRVIDMIRDQSDSWKAWNLESSYHGVEITSKRPSDSHPLKTFRVWTDVASSPKSVMMRILKERHLWDSAVINWRHVEYVVAPDTDIHQYVLNETIGHPTKDCHVARFHSSGLTEIRGACAIAERSVKCSEDLLLGGVTATIFDQRFLIEPIGGGHSRVNFLARVDLKGRSLQWYNKSFGSIMCRQLERLRDSFQPSNNNSVEKNDPQL